MALLSSLFMGHGALGAQTPMSSLSSHFFASTIEFAVHARFPIFSSRKTGAAYFDSIEEGLGGGAVGPTWRNIGPECRTLHATRLESSDQCIEKREGEIEGRLNLMPNTNPHTSPPFKYLQECSNLAKDQDRVDRRAITNFENPPFFGTYFTPENNTGNGKPAELDTLP